MNISYKWLKRYIDFTLPPRELAAALTSLGLECDQVEEIETIRGGLRGLVIGKVLTCVEHPNSDHLHITEVDLGGGRVEQIVCGAPNVAAGQTVVVATVGTTLYDGDKEFQIKKSKIRGVESNGMICAEDEIGIGDSHDGIMVLDDSIPAGTPAAEHFNVESDYCLEVELTPNRVDAASHYGVARDLRALFTRQSYEETGKAAIPAVSLPSVAGFRQDCEEGAVTVRVEDKAGCPRYSGVTVRGVKVAESPEWLRNLLLAIGQRPINNIVDITNFILNGLGQPLHCFDLSKVKGGEIVVRTCEDGRKFTTLDGVERSLDSRDLMICNCEDPMCMAGVFGGLDSGVTEATTDVFIESAWFNPTRVRRTARRHGLSTDASFRYERGTDPHITVYAAELAALMVKELAGGEICGATVDVCSDPAPDCAVDLSLNYAYSLIGKELPRELVVAILESLEIKVEETGNPDILHLTVPGYRVDVTRPCDVVEEILRVYGYNNVEFGTEMHANLSQKGDTDLSYELQQRVSNLLTGDGFMEIMNNSLTSASYYENNEVLPLDSCVKVMNPLSNDLSVMRRTLLYGGLESIAHNINRKADNLRFYEFGNVYGYDPSKTSEETKPLAPFSEHMELGIWLAGEYIMSSWNRKGVEASVFDLKATVGKVFGTLGVPMGNVVAVQESDGLFAAALVYSTRQGKQICRLGIVRHEVLKKFGIEGDVVYASVDWSGVFKLVSKHNVEFKPLPKTQPVRRDLALLVDSSESFADIESIVRKSERKLLKGVSLFDVYEGKNLPEGKKSYGISITLQDDEKTLTDQQIDSAMQRIIKALEQSGAQLR